MISTNSKYLALLLLLCVCSSCKTFSRLTNKGGIAYTVEVETSEPNKEEIIERAVRVIHNKINAVGLDGEVSRLTDKPNQISVKLYGANDAERIKKFLFTTYQLELKKAVSSASFPQIFPTKESAEKSVTGEQEVLPYPDSRDAAREQFIIVEKTAVITGENIRDASAYSSTGGAGDYQIMFSLNAEAAKKFGDWTGKNIGSYLAIVLDKKVLSVPVIKGQIFDQGMIEGRFTKESAEDIALSLKSGYLPATMKILEEKPFN
jgi:protein-export membrane protein SecD